MRVRTYSCTIIAICMGPIAHNCCIRNDKIGEIAKGLWTGRASRGALKTKVG